MAFSKRDFSRMFAEEDCRRLNAGECSVSHAITTAPSERRLKRFANIINQKAPKSGIGPIKTTDAWQRRANIVPMTVLVRAANMLGLPHERR